MPCLLLTQEIISEWRGTNPLTLGVGKEERNGEGIEERGKGPHPLPLCFFVFHFLPSAFCAYQACGRNIFSAFLFRGGGGGRNLCPRHIGQNKILACKLSESCGLYLCSFLTYHEETVEGSVIYPDCLDPNKSAKNHDLSLCVAIYTVFTNGGHAGKNWCLVMKARRWRVNKNCKWRLQWTCRVFSTDST